MWHSIVILLKRRYLFLEIECCKEEDESNGENSCVGTAVSTLHFLFARMMMSILRSQIQMKIKSAVYCRLIIWASTNGECWRMAV
mmetsp:Transcript_18790/g.34004  ORF Transcript_18790/g.34004 Transcript_18790/m.34004 type:complete len:85 (-) Transcript_18790:190-444(-)